MSLYKYFILKKYIILGYKFRNGVIYLAVAASLLLSAAAYSDGMGETGSATRAAWND
jgi:hypothetical protein